MRRKSEQKYSIDWQVLRMGLNVDAMHNIGIHQGVAKALSTTPDYYDVFAGHVRDEILDNIPDAILGSLDPAVLMLMVDFSIILMFLTILIFFLLIFIISIETSKQHLCPFESLSLVWICFLMLSWKGFIEYYLLIYVPLALGFASYSITNKKGFFYSCLYLSSSFIFNIAKNVTYSEEYLIALGLMVLAFIMTLSPYLVMWSDRRRIIDLNNLKTKIIRIYRKEEIRF